MLLIVTWYLYCPLLVRGSPRQLLWWASLLMRLPSTGEMSMHKLPTVIEFITSSDCRNHNTITPSPIESMKDRPHFSTIRKCRRWKKNDILSCFALINYVKRMLEPWCIENLVYVPLSPIHKLDEESWSSWSYASYLLIMLRAHLSYEQKCIACFNSNNKHSAQHHSAQITMEKPRSG